MEVVVGKVRLQPRPRVAVGVDRDEDREHVAPAALEPLEHRPHLVELVGADVGALGEAKVQQHPPPVQVGAAHRLAVGIEERERPAEVGPARRPLPRELPLVLVLVEPVQPGERRRRRAPGDRAAQPLPDCRERLHSFWWRLGAERSCSLAAHVRERCGRNSEARRSPQHCASAIAAASWKSQLADHALARTILLLSRPTTLQPEQTRATVATVARRPRFVVFANKVEVSHRTRNRGSGWFCVVGVLSSQESRNLSYR